MKIDGNAVRTSSPTPAGLQPQGGATPAGGRPPSWSGGFSWAIPRGAKHPEEAWQFIQWMSSVEAGLLIAGAEYRLNRSWGRLYVPEISPNKRINEAVFREYAPRHPRFRRAFRFALEMMSRSRYRPVTPVGQVLWDEHVRAMDLAIHHKYSPRRR